MVSKLNAYWLLVCGKSFSMFSVNLALGFVFDTIFLPFWKNDGDTDIHRQGGGNFLRFMSFFTLIYQNSTTKTSKANYVITISFFLLI